MESALDFLVIGTLWLATLTAFYKKSICGLVFILPMLAHYFLSSGSEAIPNLVTSGFLSAITVIILKLINTEESLNYAVLSIACVVVDIIGCVMWFNYQPDYLFRSLFAIIYLISIYMMGRENGRDTTLHRLNSWTDISRHIHNQCRTQSKKRKAT